MDLNCPGASLFQGNDLSDFDNLAQREEEQEALEEQIRRDLELKSMLENAFDDVSFENDDESICKGSPSHSTNHSPLNNNSSNEFDVSSLKKNRCNGILSDLEKNGQSNHVVNFTTPSKHSRNGLAIRNETGSDNDNYPDQCRKKIQNGNLHDIIDASGGGSGAVQSPHFKHCFQRSPLNEIPNGISHSSNESLQKAQGMEEAYDSGEQLKILYDVRVREVHRLTELIDTMRKEHEVAVNKFKHQLAISQAEIERANISQNQLQSLLVASKQDAEQLGKKIVQLESENLHLESCKNELATELETNRVIINDLERKVLVLEKGNKSNSEAVLYENNLKAVIEKHNFELINVKSEKEKVRKQCEELVKENEELKLKLNRLSQVNDETIASKCEIINRLSKQIDETQKQCETLMKSSTAENNLRLQMEVKLLKEEKLLLTSKLDALEKENSRQEDELRQYDSLSKINSFASFGDSKDMDGTEISGKLGDELYRALNGQRARRQEIKNLQSQLDEKNKKIELLTDNEKLIKCEINKLQKTVNELSNEIKNYKDYVSTKETENETLKAQVHDLEEKAKSAASKEGQLQEEIESLKTYAEDLSKRKVEVKNYNSEEYMRFHNESLQRVREESEKFYKLEILRRDLENENLKKEIEEIKNLYVEVFTSKEELIKQIEKEKNSSSGRSSVVDVDEVKRLQKELDKSRQRIMELDQTLKQQYEQEVEILNLDINQLKLQMEKLKKEKDREVSEKDKMFIENELLKAEIEQTTSEKNLLLLDFEKLNAELEEIRRDRQGLQESNKSDLKVAKEKYETEMRNLSEKYEVIVRKLKKEIELTLSKSAKVESKFTSPMKGGSRNAECQCSPPERKSASPRPKICVKDTCTSPVSVFKGNPKSGSGNAVRHVSIATEPEANKLSRREVVEIMEKLGAHHENEMRCLESKYRMELSKLDKKFQVELDRAKDIIRTELEREHAAAVERMNEKHKIELENRIEEEKKEAVADLITEWACEVQSLKASYAEAQTEMERMKMKYKAAKSVALQYKTYFKSKTEHMKEEWKRIESGYEQALKELEKNVHILVDVKEDEVKAKVDSITKIYEQKINKMKEKLSKCEGRLKGKKESDPLKRVTQPKPIAGEADFNRDLEKLQLPDVNLCFSPSTLKDKKKGENGRVELKRKKKELEALLEKEKRNS